MRVLPPPLPRDDLRLSNTTGILQKENVVSSDNQSVKPFLSGAPPPKKKNPGSVLASFGRLSLNCR